MLLFPHQVKDEQESTSLTTILTFLEYIFIENIITYRQNIIIYRRGCITGASQSSGNSHIVLLLPDYYCVTFVWIVSPSIKFREKWSL